MRFGHEPDTQAHREADCHPETGCLYRASNATIGTVIRPLSRLHSQPLLPDCTGEAIAACIEAQLGPGSAVSGRDLWQEGLRRSGRTPSLSEGLAFVPAFVGIERRGWADYHAGEELELPPAKPSLEDELDAADRPGRVVERRRIPTGLGMVAQLADALWNGCEAVIGMLVADDYQDFAPPRGSQVICGADLLGSRGTSHAQRVLGLVELNGRLVAILQNSWGIGWGGALVNKNWLPGCALVSLDALERAHDCHVLMVRK